MTTWSLGNEDRRPRQVDETRPSSSSARPAAMRSALGVVVRLASFEPELGNPSYGSGALCGGDPACQLRIDRVRLYVTLDAKNRGVALRPEGRAAHASSVGTPRGSGAAGGGGRRLSESCGPRSRGAGSSDRSVGSDRSSATVTRAAAAARSPKVVLVLALQQHVERVAHVVDGRQRVRVARVAYHAQERFGQCVQHRRERRDIGSLPDAASSPHR